MHSRPGFQTTPGSVALMIMLVFGLTAFAIRLFRLSDWGLWIDEMYTIDHTAELFATGLTFRPLGFFLHGIWLSISGIDVASLVPAQYESWRALGITPFNMRFPSMLLGAVSIPIVIWVLRRVLDRIELVIFAAALSFSVWHIWMSQVARFYTLQFLLFAVALIFYYRATADGNFRLFCWSMVVTVAAFFTQATSLMLLAIFIFDWLFVLLCERRSLWRRKHWIALSVALATCLAWTMLFYWLNPTDYMEFYAGHQSFTTMLAGSIYLAGLPTVMLALGCGAMLWKTNPRWAFFLTAAWLTPVLAFACLRFLEHAIHVRYLFVALFPCLLLFAIGLARLYEMARANYGTLFALTPVIGLLGAIAFQSFLYFNFGYGYRARWPEAVAYVAANRLPGDNIAGAQGGTAMAKYYLGEAGVSKLDPVLDAHAAGRLTHPTWVIARVYEPSIGSNARQFVPGVLKTYYSNQVSQPLHVVNVIRVEPTAGMNGREHITGTQLPQ